MFPSEPQRIVIGLAGSSAPRTQGGCTPGEPPDARADRRARRSKALRSSFGCGSCGGLSYASRCHVGVVERTRRCSAVGKIGSSGGLLLVQRARGGRSLI